MDSLRQCPSSSYIVNIIFGFGVSFLLVSFLAEALADPACPPAEEGKPYQLQCVIPSSSLSTYGSDVYWDSDGRPEEDRVICSCQVETKRCICTKSGPPVFLATGFKATLTSDSSNYTFVFYISNVTRSYAWDAWVCGQSRQIFKLCPWTVFARAKNPTCAVQNRGSFNTEKVIVLCTAEDIYPPDAQCHFYRRTTGSLTQNLTSGSDITVQSQGKQCTLRVTPGVLGAGQHRFGVYMYPNVTGNATMDEAFEVSSSDTNPIKIGPPTAKISDCPGSTDSVNVVDNYAVEGTDVTCTCTRTDDTFFPASVRWIDTFGGTSSGGPESKTLTFMAQKNQVLRCEVTSSINLSSQVTQSLRVGLPPAVVSFIISEYTSMSVINAGMVVTFSCEAEGNPSPSLSLQKRVLGTDLPVNKTGRNTLSHNKTVECQDTGVYICVASSELGGAFRKKTLNVACPQELINSDNQHEMYSGRKGDSLNISVSVFGYPEPAELHLAGDKTLLEANDVEINYFSQEPPNGTVNINFVQLEENNFQSYILNVTNTQGSLIYHFQIKIKENDSATDVEIGAIVGGVAAAGVVVILVIVIIIVRRKGLCRKFKRESTADLQLRNSRSLQEADKRLAYENALPDSHQQEIPQTSAKETKTHKISQTSGRTYENSLSDSPYEEIPNTPVSNLETHSQHFGPAYENAPPDSHYEEIPQSSENEMETPEALQNFTKSGQLYLEPGETSFGTDNREVIQYENAL